MLIAWPGFIVAAALVSLPFIGASFLIRKRRREGLSDPTGDPKAGSNDNSPSEESADWKEPEATSPG